jgi:hypothetical protein
MMRALLCALIAVVPGIGVAEELRPDHVPDKARQLVDKGRAYHDAGEYRRAIAAFQEAYALAPSPGLLFNLAQAYRLAGDCDDAAWMYHRYLDTNPSTERRTVAENQLAIVEKCGHDTLKVAVEPRPLTSTAATPPPPSEPVAEASARDDALGDANREKQAGVALAIGGAVLFSGAAVYAFDAYEASETVSDAYRRGERGAEVKPIELRGERSTTNAEWLALGGVAFTAAGVALYLHGRHVEQTHTLLVAPAAHGTGVSVSWRF